MRSHMDTNDVIKEGACNMCHKKMKLMGFGLSENVFISVCVNPRCPNYALLQLPAEKMPKEE
jgi:hypothetical protein